MNLILLLLMPSLFAILTLPFIVSRRMAAYWSAGCSTISFSVALFVVLKTDFNAPIFFFHQWFFCDKLSIFFIALNTFIMMTTSFYTISYLNNESPIKLYGLFYRFYYTAMHIFSCAMLFVIVSNNIALMWIAMELVTISSVILISLHQTQEALEAAWKYLMLCGVGIGLALLGTVILYFSAHAYLNADQGLLWTALYAKASLLPTKLLAIAFVFLFIGYGTKVGFFPLHNWLPDAYTESSIPFTTLSSGLLLNVALLILLRFKLLLAHTELAKFASTLFLVFGFMSLIFASLSLLRQRKLKRLLAYSSIEHMGLISIAFGIGTPLAYFAGLLHIMMHSLSKSAAFFSTGSIVQRFQTQSLNQLKGLLSVVPLNAWCLLFSCFAILGLPPFGLFFSELLIILAIIKTHVWLLLPLLFGLAIAFLAILAKIQRVIFSAYPVPYQPLQDTRQLTWPVILHLTVVVLAGFWLPYFFLHPIISIIMKGS